MHVDPRAALLACAALDSSDVALGALWLAAEDCDGVDVDANLARLDELAEAARERGAAESPEGIAALAALFHESLSLRGTGGGDPRAHYLHQLLERGAGVPLAAAVLWIAIGRRAGLAVDGVALPGHFAVRINSLLINPFSGDLIEDDEAKSQVDNRWLLAVSTRDICMRMSRNLRGCYINRQDWKLALQAADRCVALKPDSAADIRDRGLLRWQLGMSTPAAEDLRRYLTLAPAASDRDGVGEILAKMRASSN